MDDVTVQDVLSSHHHHHHYLHHHNNNTNNKNHNGTASSPSSAPAPNNRGLPNSKKTLRPRMSYCFFPVDASNKAIDQARQLKILRKENAELKALLEKKAAPLGDCTSPPSIDNNINIYHNSPRATKRAPSSSLQWRVRPEEPPDSLIYGCLSAQEIQSKLDQLESQPKHCRPVSLAHPALREVNTFAYQDAPADPFPSLWKPSLGPKSLLDILPSPEEIYSLLTVFDKQAQCFQYIPNKLATPEVECFLADLQNGAERNPQMLGMILAAMAHAVQFRQFGKNVQQWVPGAMEKELFQADIYIAASMHALRLSSYMNRPTLLAVQTLLLIGAYLINTGKFLDAYTLYGQTIRVAQGMGLHQDPQSLTPTPSQKECHLRRNLWWLMLFMDQFYSMTLGRPLGICGIGNCPPSSQLSFCELGDNQKARRLEMYVNQYTVLSRQIISCESLTNTKIDEFTDRLLQLQETLPALVRFKESWLDEQECQVVAPEWPLNFHAAVFHCYIHNYLILLNRKRQGSAAGRGRPKKHSDDRPERGYATVISSCHEVLRTFFYCRKNIPISLVHWSLGQQAFNAAMLLTLNMLERRPSNRADYEAVASAYNIFREMQEKSVSRPAKIAVERLKGVLDAVTAMQNNDYAHHQQQQQQQQQPPPPPKLRETETVMSNRGMILIEDPEIRVTGSNGNVYYAPTGFRLMDLELSTLMPASGSQTPESPGTSRKRRRRSADDVGPSSGGDQGSNKAVKLERSRSASGVAPTPTTHLRKICPRKVEAKEVNDGLSIYTRHIQQKAARNGQHPYSFSRSGFGLQVMTHEVPVQVLPISMENQDHHQYAASALYLHQSVSHGLPDFNQQIFSSYACAGIY
ncbi:hypothetical protein VTN02DRAFT_5142 [Thermoascus thermophilus]